MKAVDAIVKVVSWIVSNASRMMSLVNSVVDSIAAIANGDSGGASSAIEGALAGALPVAISFLANLVGLGDLPKKIQGVIQTARRPVNSAIQWLIGQAKKLAKAVMGKVGEKKGETLEQEKALPDIDTEEGKYLKEGKIAEEDAEKVASSVKAANPILKSLTVVDGGERWDFDYLFRSTKQGAAKIPGELSVDKAIRELQMGAKDVTIRTLDEARAVIKIVYPGAEERPGTNPASAFDTEEKRKEKESFRKNRSMLMMFHIDIGRYNVSEMRTFIEKELERLQAELDKKVVTGAWDAKLDASIRELKGVERDFERMLPTYQQLEKEGVLYGHEDEKMNPLHRTNPHINIEGSRVEVCEGLETRVPVKATLYISGGK